MAGLQDRLARDLVSARRERDHVRVSVLRTTMSALSNSEAVDATAARPQHGVFSTEAPRRLLSEAEAAAVIAGEHDALLVAAEEYEAQGRADAAARLRAQAAILARYVPDG